MIGQRTWKDHLGRKMKKGKFEKDEQSKIQKRLQEIAKEENLTIEELYNLLVTPSKKSKPKLWT